MKYILLLLFLLSPLVSAESTTIIGCMNMKNYNDIRPPIDWKNCFYGKWWLNIKAPSDSELKEIMSAGYNHRQAVNRLAIINFESSFNINAGNKFAHWYVQTLRKWNISKDIKSQITWMKNREERGYPKWCSRYWNEDNKLDKQPKWEDGVIACYYRYHHGRYSYWYSKRAMAARNVYLYHYWYIKDWTWIFKK